MHCPKFCQLFYKVILHLFEWTEPKDQPDDDEIVAVMESKFSMRLDIRRKIIEYAMKCSLDDVYTDELTSPKKQKVD